MKFERFKFSFPTFKTHHSRCWCSILGVVESGNWRGEWVKRVSSDPLADARYEVFWKRMVSTRRTVAFLHQHLFQKDGCLRQRATPNPVKKAPRNIPMTKYVRMSTASLNSKKEKKFYKKHFINVTGLLVLNICIYIYSNNLSVKILIHTRC